MEHRFETTHPLTADIRIPAGTIAVRVHDEAFTTARIEGAHAEDVVVGFDEHPGGDRLTVEYRGRKVFSWLGLGDQLGVTIQVPEATSLDVSTGSADVEVSGTVARIDFKSGSGELRFNDVNGDVTAKTASGDLSGDGVGGGLRFNGASGDLSIGSVSKTTAGRTASGDISIGRIDADTQLSSASGDVTIGVVTGGRATVRTVSGDVAVGVIEGADVYLDLASTSGDMVCDLEPATRPSGGSAELEVDLTSVSGDVRVRKVAGTIGRS